MSARKKNSLNRRVRNTYRQEDLETILTMPEQEFGSAFEMKTVEVDQRSWRAAGDQNDYYHFRDNGARVLAVAHLDTVVDSKGRTPRFRNTQTGPLVVSGALDDRLGAYVVLKLLPELGVSTDVLLTVGEESGQSTASFFDPAGKTYDHVIEFDRGGTDVVMYQYDDAATRAAVRASGARVGNGSFSDIAYLEHLGVKCFNWGAGYRGDYHSERGYAFLYDTFAMVARYLRFSEQNAGIAMPHVPEPEPAWYAGYRAGKRAYDWPDDDKCWYCGQDAVDATTRYCGECTACQDCGDFEEACICYLPPRERAKTSLPALEDGYGNSWAGPVTKVALGEELND